jgi:hypothetical protein
VPADARFVRFVADRYQGLHGFGTVALAVALMTAAPLWRRDWGPTEWWTLGGIAAALAVLEIAIARYYVRAFGRTTSWHRPREPWYAVIGIAVVERGVRGLGGRALETGVLALGLGGAFAFQAWKEWPFRKLAGVPALCSLYVGIDRLTASADVDLSTWLMRTTILFAAALAVVGLADHRLIVRALSPAHRPLALSVMPGPSGDSLPWAVRDPVGATMVTALHACADADVTFVGNIAGLRREQASARLEDLQIAGLVVLEDRGRGSRRTPFARLTAKGHDVARRLWGGAAATT